MFRDKKSEKKGSFRLNGRNTWDFQNSRILTNIQSFSEGSCWAQEVEVSIDMMQITAVQMHKALLKFLNLRWLVKKGVQHWNLNCSPWLCCWITCKGAWRMIAFLEWIKFLHLISILREKSPSITLEKKFIKLIIMKINTIWRVSRNRCLKETGICWRGYVGLICIWSETTKSWEIPKNDSSEFSTSLW